MALASLPKPPKSGEAALPGREGEQLNNLIDLAERKGTATLTDILVPAIKRLLDGGAAKAMTSPHIFNGAELAKLTDAFAATIGTGSLLGAARIRQKQVQAELTKDYFAEVSGPFATVQNEELPILPPWQALDYFKSLIPRLGVDPIHWAPLMQRTAFTLAAATEKTIVEDVQKVILDRMRTGQQWIPEADRLPGQQATGVADIQQILDETGCSPANPQYAQMVFRTNTMESYTTGYQLEMEHPDVKDFFPAWLYMGILDGREGDDHRPRFGRYYPNSLPFAVVRGARVFNCRCVPNAIDKYKWKRLQAQGATFSTL